VINAFVCMISFPLFVSINKPKEYYCVLWGMLSAEVLDAFKNTF